MKIKKYKVIDEFPHGQALAIIFSKDIDPLYSSFKVRIEDKVYSFLPTSSLRCILVQNRTLSCLGKNIEFLY